MRVLVLNRDPNSHPGGDLVHIANLTKALLPLGIERLSADRFPMTPDVIREWGVDLIHIYHLNFGFSRLSWDQAKEAQRVLGVPYIVTPIFYPTDKLGMGADEMRGMLEGAGRVVCYSGRESDEIREVTGWQGMAGRIPPGVGEEFHHPNVADGDGREGVLTVAARAGDKNTDLVREMCVELDLPYRHVSGLPHDRMPFVYRQARVFVNASGSERFGLTTLEALAGGCRVVSTVHSRGLKFWMGKGLVEADYQDRDDLSGWINRAYHWPGWNHDPNRRARHLTWGWVADQYKTVYDEVLEKGVGKC